MVNVLDRRRFLTLAGSLPLAFAPVSRALAAAPALGRRTLILVELNGGNDGLNTVVPYADPKTGVKHGGRWDYIIVEEADWAN